MKLRSLLLAPALALAAALAPAAPAWAQDVPAPVQSNAVPATPALWVVADADTTIYLFGTIHLLPDGIAWYNGPVAAAFEASGELVTELPATAAGENATMALKYGVLPKGQTLRAAMTKSELATFEAALAGQGLPPAAFDRYKPWFAAVVLATLPLARQGFNVAQGVENQLDMRNQMRGKPRLGLETLDYQLSIFDRFPAAVQKRYLFEVIEALPTIDQEIGKMIDSWAKGDASGLAALMNADAEDPALYQALLTDRNRAWAQWIAARLARPGTVFIAVGAGHLGGKDSVQDQLAKAGVKSERVQ